MSLVPSNQRPGLISRILSPGEPIPTHGNSEIELRAAQAEREAVERSFYVSNRMTEAKVLAHKVIDEPNEMIRSQLVPWFELHQQLEQHIYRKTFG